MSIASQAILEPAALVEVQGTTPDEESIRDHTSTPIAPGMLTDSREVVCASKNLSLASTKDLESPPIHWNLIEIHLALEKARLGEDLPQPWANWMGRRRAEHSDLLNFIRNKLNAE